MFPLKYLIGFGGVSVAGTGVGVGIYYGTRSQVTDQKPQQPENCDSSGTGNTA